MPAKAANARDAALRVLARHAEKMPDLAPADPETEGMDPRDAALAHAIIDATVRRWITLSYLVEVAGGRDVRDMEPRMQAALLGGAAQLLLFDRIPDHAAIDETVEWAKRRIRPKAGGMVNAVASDGAGGWYVAGDVRIATGQMTVVCVTKRPDAPMKATAIPEHIASRLAVAGQVGSHGLDRHMALQRCVIGLQLVLRRRQRPSLRVVDQVQDKACLFIAVAEGVQRLQG